MNASQRICSTAMSVRGTFVRSARDVERLIYVKNIYDINEIKIIIILSTLVY